MLLRDLIKLSLGSLVDQRLRSFLTVLGIASVVLLTSIGEGVRRFMLSEFTQFGTNLISINPGKTTTIGVSGAIINNIRPLSIADEEALRRIAGVIDTIAVVQGNAPVEREKRSRHTTILGVGPTAAAVFTIDVARGRFLPVDDQRAARAYVALGSKVAFELFRETSPLGKIVRIGGERYRVIG